MLARYLRFSALVAAGLILAGTAAAADEAKKPPPPPKGFYAKFFNPRMDARLKGEIAAAAEFVNPAANPWTRDNRTVSRIERGAFSAAKSALKQYAIQGLHLDGWSVPLVGGHGTGLGALRDDSGGTRLRFGISNLTPRADVLVPTTYGRAVFSFDAKGRVATSFQSHASNFSVGVAYDPPARSGSFSLGRRF